MISGRYRICSRHRKIFCYQCICFSSFIIFFESKNEPALSVCTHAHTQQRRRLFLEVAAALSSVAESLEQQSVCFDSQACQELNISAVGVALLRCFPHLGLGAQAVQAAMQFAHRSSLPWWDDVCAWGSEEKGQAEAVAGNTNVQPDVPPVLGTSGEAAARSVLLCQSPEAAHLGAFLRLYYWELLFLCFASPAANWGTG